MATIVNDIDVLLQAATSRTVSVSLPPNIIIPAVKQLRLTASSVIFQVNTSGVASPTAITLTAEKVQITGTVSFTVTSGTATLTGTGDTRSLAYSGLATDTAVIQASLVDGGVTYTAQVTIAKVRDGSSGTSGTRNSTGYVYYSTAQSTTPATPTATSYNFSTGAFTGLSTGWGTTYTSGTHTSTTNEKWWAARFYVSEATLGGAQTITFTTPFVHTSFDGLVTFTNLNSPSGTTFIDGGNIKTGTVSAQMFNGVGIQIGTGGTPNGRAFEVNGAGATWIDGAIVYNANIQTKPGSTSNALYAASSNTKEAVAGIVTATNSNPGAHGVRGYNYYAAGAGSGWSGVTNNTPGNGVKGVGGLIGSANGYDFYADGNGQNYGPFTGTHDSLLPNGEPVELGQIVVDTGNVVQRNGWSSTINVAAVSSAPNQPGALGVVCGYRPLADVQPAVFVVDRLEDGTPVLAEWYEANAADWQCLGVNAVGEGQVLVCGEGGDLAVGDLIVTSSLPGVGMKQADDILRACTVAKVREAVTFDNSAQVKTVACIYLCG